MTDRHDDGYGSISAPGTIRIERLLPGPIERIWSYVTEPERRRQWLAGGAIELRSGGCIEHIFRNADFAGSNETAPQKFASMDREIRLAGQVRECRPPYLLVYTWNGNDDDPSEVRFELEERGKKVLLTVTHSQLAQRGMMTMVAAGWHTHLDILTALLEARTSDGFWAKFARLHAEYDRRIPPG